MLQKMRIKTHRKLLFVLLIIIILVGRQSVFAQVNNATNWSDPEVIFEFPNLEALPITSISAIEDPRGNLHVFWSIGSPLEESGIYYSKSEGGFWSSPIDVLVSPENDPVGQVSAKIDTDGNIHLTWHEMKGLYYSQVDYRMADQPNAWLRPKLLVENSNTSSLWVDHDGVVHMLYTVITRDNAVLYSRCEDLCTQFFETTRVADIDDGQAAGYTSLLVDGGGNLHAAWGQFESPAGWPPTGVFYSRSLDAGALWMPAVQVGGENQGHPTLFESSGGKLHLVWLATATTGRYYTYSLDQGENWAKTLRFDPYEVTGLNVGVARIVEDSLGALYLVMGGGPGGLDAINDARWLGVNWSPLERITPGGQLFPELILTKGNRLNLFYVSAQGNSDQVLYSWRNTGSPEIDVSGVDPELIGGIPTSVIPTELSLIKTALPKATTTVSVDINQEKQGSLDLISRIPIISGITAAMLVFMVFLVIRRIQRRK